MTETVRVLLFAGAREAAGRAELRWSVPESGLPARELLEAVTQRFPALRGVLRASRVVRNGEYLTGLTVRILPGDEVAIHPPYSGG